MSRLGKKRRKRLIVGAMIVVVGLGIMTYPYVSDWVYKVNQSHVIADQDEAVEERSLPVLDEALARAQEYNEQLAVLRGASTAADPFSASAEGSDEAAHTEYESLLNLRGDGVMGSLSIAAIGLEVPIYHGTVGEDLQKGVGHMEGTSLPVGGASTHTVLAGHNGLPSVKIFDALDRLQEGDVIVVRVLGEELEYRVTGSEIVLPNETSSLAIQEGRDLMTLVTCLPYGINSHRLLVHAERMVSAETPEEEPHEDVEESSAVAWIPAATVAGIAAVAVVVFGIGLALNRKRA